MVLNLHGFEPTFFKLDSWSPGAGFIQYNLQFIKIDKEKCKKKNMFYAYKKYLTQFLKICSIPPLRF